MSLTDSALTMSIRGGSQQSYGGSRTTDDTYQDEYQPWVQFGGQLDKLAHGSSYKTVSLVMDCPPGLELTPAVYPRAKILYVPAINKHVPAFEGTFRIPQDLKVSSAYEFSESLPADGKTLTITGKLAYQACDRRTCFLPTSAPIQWQVHVLPLDQRSPENIPHE